MEELVHNMKVILASCVSLYIKSSNYHWNVTGQNFKANHDLFHDVYETYQSSIDTFAEEIRILGAISPGSLSRFKELSVIQDEMNVPSAKFMIIKLTHDTEIFLELLKDAFKLTSDNIGLNAILGNEISKFEKLLWMLRSFEE